MIDYSAILTVNYSASQWSLNGNSYDGLEWLDTTPKPSQQELDDLWLSTQEYYAKQACKKEASKLLYETDWTTIPDIANSANTPYLVNQAEFIAWRSQVRALAVNPVANPTFPAKPTEVWG